MRPTRLVILSLGVAAVAMLPLMQNAASAQGRRAVPRAAPRGGRVVVAGYYRPLFLSPFYNPFYDPWWYPFPYAGYPPYGYPGFAYDTASMRLQVSPRETEVFVDGYFAGIADEFDGMFQRLQLAPGPHEVTLYLAGHRTLRQNVFLQDRGTFRIRHTMERLGSGEAAEPRPAATVRPQERRGAASAVGDPSFGAIAIRVQPADAEVLIDGEMWDGPRDDEALVVQVTPGPHVLEVRKDGYRSYTAEVRVTASETAPINVSLSRE